MKTFPFAPCPSGRNGDVFAPDLRCELSAGHIGSHQAHKANGTLAGTWTRCDFPHPADRFRLCNYDDPHPGAVHADGLGAFPHQTGV